MRDPAGGRSKIERDPELRTFVAARIGQLMYRELADLARRRFGPERAPSQSAIGRWAKVAGRRRSYPASKIERDPELRAFIAARIGQLMYRELADLARRRFGPERVPSQSAIGRWAGVVGRRRSYPVSKIERDAELRVFVAARVTRLPYRELADLARRHFGPERAVSHSAIGRWAGAVGRRRRRGWLARIDADPALSAFLEARADRLSVQALAERARAAFGDRAPPRAAINRWNAHRRAAKAAPSPAREAARGRTAAERALEQRARCSWCDRGFRPRKGTGGSPQRFCGAPCRRAFDSTARRYVRKAIAEGQLVLADLWTCPMPVR